MLMYQKSLDLQFPLTQQFSLDLDVPVDIRDSFAVPFTSELIIASDFTGTTGSYLTVNDSVGVEAARIDDQGISLRMENKSWLKTKIANWLGVRYL